MEKNILNTELLKSNEQSDIPNISNANIISNEDSKDKEKSENIKSISTETNKEVFEVKPKIQQQINPNHINKPKFYVLIYNLSKAKNIGTLIRSAAAFGCYQVFILGADKKILKKFFGSQGTVDKSEFVFFNKVDELKEHCEKNKIHICGVEIGKSSKPIQSHPFRGDTLFILGNEGAGMNEKQKDLCGDHLVYIPQYSNKTASLNVAVAASIIFQHYSCWAGYEEFQLNDSNEEKFGVDKSLQKNVIYYENMNSTDIKETCDSNIGSNQNN